MTTYTYAEVVFGVVQKIQTFDHELSFDKIAKDAAGDLYWRPLVVEQPPAFNPLTYEISGSEMVVQKMMVISRPVVTRKAFADIRTALAGEAKRRYVARLSAGLAWNATIFQVDEQAQLDIAGITTKILAGYDPDTATNWKGWRRMDNGWQPMTKAQFIEFGQAVSDFVIGYRLAMWEHVDRLTNPTYPNFVADLDLEAYNLDGLWPQPPV